MIDREKLTAELAKLHGIRIDADDPILVAALLNHRLLDDAIMRVEMSVRASADRITTAAVQQVDGARDVAAALVTRAGEWSAERLRTAVEEACAGMLAEARREAANAAQASRTTVRMAWLVGGVAGVLLGGLAGVLLAGLMHG